MFPEKTVLEVKEMLDSKVDFQLIDVRQQDEKDIANIGGELIPMNDILYAEDKISKDKPVVIYCRTGNRSLQVVMQLQTMYGFDNLYNMKGGIYAWSDEIDASITKY
jgi:adenylyltransferase/sulfurtransferase